MPMRAWIAVSTIALVFATAKGDAFAQATPKSISTRSYKIGTEELNQLSSRLQASLSKVDPAAEVYVDLKQNKIIVRGTAAVQAQASQLIADAPVAAAKARANQAQANRGAVNRGGVNRAPANRPQAKPSSAKADPNVVQASFDDLIPSQVKLRYSSANQFCDRLQKAFGRAATISTRSGGSVEVQLRVDGEMTRGVTLNSSTSLVQLPADARHKKFWWQTVQAIDRQGTKEDPQSAILKLDKADPAKIKRAIEVYQAAMRRRQIEGDDDGMQDDEEMLEEDGGPRIITDITDGEGGEGGFGAVQIEVLEGLDVIVIRGRKQDVERIQKIIADIERQTRETKPEIEIVPLNHVQDSILADYVNQIYSDIYGTRQGRVTILPLKRPNAILLAGKAENVLSAKELIAKLDQPNDSQAQLKVIHLKHISAADAESTVNRILTTTPGGAAAPTQPPGGATQLNGLDNRAVIISDTRINALFIFASPRDIAEVEKLVTELDVEELTSQNEIRFFRLRNALSDDLKATLDAAIGGQIAGGAAGTSGTQGNVVAGLTGGPGAAPTTSGSSSSASRNAGLQFLKVDEEGQRLIKSGILNDVQISSDPRSNTLVVTGPANTMPLMEVLIEQLDTLAQADAAIKVFTVVNGDAAALVDTLQQLFGQTTQGQGAAAGGGGVVFATPGAEESTLVSLRFGFDERTNSIIVTGAARDLDTVERLLIRLDESDVRRRRSTVYHLLNAPAEDVAIALQEFLTSQRQLAQLAPTLQSPIEQFDREVLVVAEPVSNSLLVSSTMRYFEEMKGIIEELDRRPPMVVVQTLIAEVTLGENNEFGVELGLQDALLYRRGINGATATPGFNFNNQPLPSTNASPQALATADNVAGQALGNFAMGRTNPALGYGGLVLSASSQSVSALVRALQQNRQLQVISRPQIQTLDNQLGRVQVGATVPYPTSVQVTTFGTSTGVQLYDVGIILEVRPRTSPDGLIVMEVGAEKSQLGPEAEGIAISVTANGTVRAPQIQRTRAVTVVSARTGQTVILGGLITKSRENETRRVPYLADIPVVGTLFRYDRNVEAKTELLIFLTPYIVRNEDDIDFINAQEAARMNWCLSDIADAHGQVPGMAGEGPWGQQQTPVIFPDEDPTGMKTLPPSDNGTPDNLPTLRSGSRAAPKKSALLGDSKKDVMIVPMGPVQGEPLTLETERPANDGQFRFEQQ